MSVALDDDTRHVSNRSPSHNCIP